MCYAACSAHISASFQSVCNPLGGFAKLDDGPVCGISLGYAVGQGVVDPPLGEGGPPHHLTLGNGEEAVAQAFESELGPAGLADAGVQMMRVLEMR